MRNTPHAEPSTEPSVSGLRARFETDWTDGRPADLGAVVRSVPEPARPELFRQLLDVERRYRERFGRPLVLGEALDRFRSLGDWIEPIVKDLIDGPGTKSWPAPERPDPGADAPGPRPGRAFLGQYELLATLGSGANGTVYRARHTRLRRLVALKVLIPHRLLTPVGLGRFRREMEVLGRLNHPHVVRATDAGDAHGRFYLAMEYVPGVDLGHVLKRLARLSVADACELARQAADALAHIGRAGMVHRDVKPSNLLLGRDGLLRVLDLGLALLRDGPTWEALTESGAVMGTPEYMAPEQTRESRDVDVRADVYALGCTLFALLTGAPPFARAGAMYDVLRAHNETPPPALRARREGAPADLEQLLFRMLEKEPARRPPPDEVAAALTPFCAGHGLVRLLAEYGPGTEGPVALPPAFARLDFAATETPPPAEPAAAFVTPAAARRRGGRRAGAAVLLALGMAAAAWAIRPGPKPVETEPEPAPLRPRAFRPGEWTELLDRPPLAKRVWLDRDPRSLFTFHAPTRSLDVSCLDFGFLELARVEADEFELEAVVFQHNWKVGRVGVFFRGLPAPDCAPRFSWQAETLALRSLDAPTKTVTHSEFGVLADTGGHEYRGMRHYRVECPVSDSHTLSCAVVRGGITDVRWDGKPLEVIGPPSEEVRPVGGRGGLGVFAHDSNALFLSVRVRIPAPPPPKGRP
jgi:hypothetical protein